MNTGGVLVAAKRAVQGFEQLPFEVPKTFIYTGNFLNRRILPAFISQGMGKSASAHLIAVASTAYGPKEYRYVAKVQYRRNFADVFLGSTMQTSGRWMAMLPSVILVARFMRSTI